MVKENYYSIRSAVWSEICGEPLLGGRQRRDKKYHQSQSAWSQTWQGLGATSPDSAISLVHNEKEL